MSQAAAISHHAVEPAESPLTPESWGKLGMWIFLAGDAVGFGVLLAGYGATRTLSADWPHPAEHLGIHLPQDDLLLLLDSINPDAAVISLTYPPAEPGAQRLARALEATGVPTLVGRPGATLSDLLLELHQKTSRPRREPGNPSTH